MADLGEDISTGLITNFYQKVGEKNGIEGAFYGSLSGGAIGFLVPSIATAVGSLFTVGTIATGAAAVAAAPVAILVGAGIGIGAIMGATDLE